MPDLRKPTVCRIVLYVTANNETLPILITNVYDDMAIGGHVFLSPAAYKRQQDARGQGHDLVAGQPTVLLVDRVPYSHQEGAVKAGQPENLHYPNTWHWPQMPLQPAGGQPR